MRNFMVVKVMVSDETFTNVILVLIICSHGTRDILFLYKWLGILILVNVVLSKFVQS